MSTTAQSIFTEGLYTLDQAARLAQVSTQLLRNWLNGSGDREPAVFRQLPRSSSEVVGFVDLIQALAIRAIRTRKKISLQKIRATITAARDLGIEYPFARKHQTFLFGDDVVIRLEDPEVRLIQATGRYKNQHLLRAIAEPYLVDLSYDAEGVASEYSPLSDGDARIVIDPRRQYGAPLVLPSGYTVASLVNAFEGEGSLSDAADAYGITEREVKLAVRYDNFLSGIAA